MKILVVTHLFTPDRAGGASVFSDFCVGLAEAGHDVQVFCGYPYYPEWTNKSEANLWRVHREKCDKVKVRRHGFFIPRTPSSLLQRVLYEASFGVSLLRSLFTARSDIVVVYCPLLGSVIFAVFRCFLTREKLWMNIQDIPADAARASGISRSALFDTLASRFQEVLFRRGEWVSTISPVMMQRVRCIGLPRQRFVYMPNWLNQTMAEKIAKLAPAGSRKHAVCPVILYAGNIGRKQGMVEFCKRMSAMDFDFALRIFGEGGEARHLGEMLALRADRRISLGKFLPEEVFVEELYGADLFVITETADVGASFLPSKLIPCIATGTPVLAICDRSGPLGTEVSTYGLGWVVPWQDIPILPRLLIETPVGSPPYRQMAEACLCRANAFRREAALRVFESEVEQLLPANRAI
jgi:colanic acid biosynthesis glycosyl transferase WcaI